MQDSPRSMRRRTLLSLAAAPIASSAWARPDRTARLLAPTGILRAVFLGPNPAQGRVDPGTGKVTGVAAELTAALADRLGVRHVIKPGAVIDDVKSGAADIGFLAYDAVRDREVDFSRTYLLVHNTYVVRADAPAERPAQVDKPGVRIGVSMTDAGGYFLQRNLKAATLVANPGGDLAAARAQLETRAIDAYAANTQRLTEAFGRDPAFRVLPGAFYSVEQAMIVQEGQAEKVSILNDFLDHAIARGLVTAAIRRAGIVGVETPKGDPNR